MRIALISMPFPSLSMPSLALTQLATVLSERFGDRVTVDTHYLDLDFARYVGGPRRYRDDFVSGGFMTGLGDWLFRQSAFPEAPDNADAYFSRFYFGQSADTAALRARLLDQRAGLDAFLDELIDAHDLAGADIVGFTALFSQTVASFAMARRLKLANPDLTTCIGGAACEGVMGKAFAAQVDAVDYVFSGPGLVGFPAFVECRMAGDWAGCETIAGVFSSDNTDDVDPVGEELDIDANLQLDYGPFLDAFEAAFPGGEARPVLLFETSRGCYWAERMVCAFCGLNGTQRCYRPMSPANALTQIHSLYRWVSRCPSFIAVDTIVPRDYLRDVLPALDLPAGMKLMYEVRPDLHASEIAALCNAGVAALQPGIESLSSHTLKLMRKGSTAFRNIRFLKACSGYAVSLDWNLLICSPGEPEATYEKYVRDIPLLLHLAPPSAAYPINFVRHSHYFENAAAYGLDLQPQDFYGLTYPFDNAIIRDIANHFVDRRADTDAMDRWLDVLNERVAYWRRRWLGEDGRPQARLCFMEDGAGRLIYDSRSGEQREHEIGPVAKTVLDFLERPARVEHVAKTLGLERDDVEEAIGELDGFGLLFEETGRYMSLVAG